MAIDTAQKRASALTVSAVWNGVNVAPDGTLDNLDRQHIAWGYVGVPVLAPPEGGLFSVISEEGIHSKIFGGVVIR